jgi:hypothetical protein
LWGVGGGITLMGGGFWGAFYAVLDVCLRLAPPPHPPPPAPRIYGLLADRSLEWISLSSGGTRMGTEAPQKTPKKTTL